MKQLKGKIVLIMLAGTSVSANHQSVRLSPAVICIIQFNKEFVQRQDKPGIDFKRLSTDEGLFRSAKNLYKSSSLRRSDSCCV